MHGKNTFQESKVETCLKIGVWSLHIYVRDQCKDMITSRDSHCPTTVPLEYSLAKPPSSWARSNSGGTGNEPKLTSDAFPSGVSTREAYSGTVNSVIPASLPPQRTCLPSVENVTLYTSSTALNMAMVRRSEMHQIRTWVSSDAEATRVPVGLTAKARI